MSQKLNAFVFIMLKPAAANDIELSNLIKNKLSKYGDIKHIRYSIIVDKEKISKHYKSSQSSLWYPFIINYLSKKTVQFFILEYYTDKYDIANNSSYSSFGEFLKTQVIGSANLCKTKKHHLRRMALKKATFLVDNLIHSSDNTQEALKEIRLWYEDEPTVIAEFETKALQIFRGNGERGNW